MTTLVEKLKNSRDHYRLELYLYAPGETRTQHVMYCGLPRDWIKNAGPEAAAQMVREFAEGLAQMMDDQVVETGMPRGEV